MAALVQSYETPSAAFEPSEANQVRVGVTALDSLLARTELTRYVFDLLEKVVGEVGEGAEDAEDDDPGYTINADGYVKVTRVCRGWVASDVPNASENGELDLTATFSERGLSPVIWGNALRCRYLAGQTPLELRQMPGIPYGLSVYWGQGVSLSALAERPLLFALNLQATLGEEELDLRLDFRSLTGQEIEYRFAYGAGSIIAKITADKTVTLRAANGSFACPEAGACTDIKSDGAGG